MKVSIIIPVYNAEKYLKECIESAINQTYQNIEIIAIYDGYPDKSLEILKTYSNKLKIVTKESGGIASALNAGLKAAEGEWIKRMAADDILFPNAVEYLIDQAKKIEDKQNTILYGDYDIIDDKGKLIDEQKEPDYNHLSSFDFNVMLLDHYIGLSESSLIHSSTLKKYGIYNEKINFEDYELWLRYCILHNCRLHFVPKKILKRRIHQGNATKILAKKSLQDTNQIKKTILNKLNHKQQEKYKNALKIYRKNKPIIEKGKYFVRYELFRFLPTSICKLLIDAYWHNRKKKK